MATYSSGPGFAELPDANGVKQTVTFTNTGEQQKVCVALWASLGLTPPTAGWSTVDNTIDYDQFPTINGIYEAAISKRGILRAGGTL